MKITIEDKSFKGKTTLAYTIAKMLCEKNLLMKVFQYFPNEEILNYNRNILPNFICPIITTNTISKRDCVIFDETNEIPTIADTIIIVKLEHE